MRHTTICDGIKTGMTGSVRAHASSNRIDEVLDYTKETLCRAKSETFGIAKGKNVTVLHLESFQQFLINMKVDGQEVTPFLNSIFQNQATISFDNFFHEVGQERQVMLKICWKLAHLVYLRLIIHRAWVRQCLSSRTSDPWTKARLYKRCFPWECS